MTVVSTTSKNPFTLVFFLLIKEGLIPFQKIGHCQDRACGRAFLVEVDLSQGDLPMFSGEVLELLLNFSLP